MKERCECGEPLSGRQQTCPPCRIEKIRIANKNWREANREKRKAYMHEYNKLCKPFVAQKRRAERARLTSLARLAIEHGLDKLLQDKEG